MRDPELVGVVRDVRGATVTAALTTEAVPGLTFSKGHAYQVGQLGTFVRIPMGLIDIFAVVMQVGAGPDPTESESVERVAWAAPGDAWMRLELLAEGPHDTRVERGVSRYPAIGDPVYLVTADDLGRLYGNVATARSSPYVRVGHVAAAPQLSVGLNLDALVSRHIAIVGSTGTGKSSTVSGLLHQISDRSRYPASRAIVVDVHGEYYGGLSDLAELREVRIGTSQTYDQELLRGNTLYLPYWALTVDELISLTFGTLDDVSTVAVRDRVLTAKRAYATRHPELALEGAEITADTPLPFSIHQLWFELHEEVYATHRAQANAQTPATRAYAHDAEGKPLRGDARRVVAPTYQPLVSAGTERVFLSTSPLNMRRQTEHLAGRLRDPRYAFLFEPGPWTPDINGEVESDLGAFLRSWLGGQQAIVLADLSNVPTAVLRDVVGVLLRILYEALVWGRNLLEGGRHRPLLLVLEEAHRYLGVDGGAAGAIVERIVKEGRKFGVGLMLISQRPSEIRATILSQVGTFIVLRLTNTTDRGLVRAALPDHLGGLFDVVPVLRTGEAVMVGEAIHLPTRVVVDVAPDRRPDSSNPSVVSIDGVTGWNAEVSGDDYDGLAAAWRRSGAPRKENQVG